MTFRIRSACLITLASFATVTSLHAKVVINEIRIDQPQAGDPDEFFELRGDPNESLAGRAISWRPRCRSLSRRTPHLFF